MKPYLAAGLASLALLVGTARAGHRSAEDRTEPWKVTNAAERAGRYLGVQSPPGDAEHFRHLELLLSTGGAWKGHVRASESDMKGDVRNPVELDLAELKVEEQSFSARLVGKRPAWLPEHLKGRFVIQYPPDKGPVDRGLLLEGGFFLAQIPMEE